MMHSAAAARPPSTLSLLLPLASSVSSCCCRTDRLGCSWLNCLGQLGRSLAVVTPSGCDARP